jgi:hypothetical protein
MSEKRAAGRRTCALFVDFDNLYSGLRVQSLGAAEEFATNPGRWLAWLRHGVEAGAEPADRRVLHLVCFLNPRAFGHYRDSFVRAGFTVVDCPPLTARNKTAADIHMAIAMLDTLAHPTHFDEFILMTGDADFLPVVTRLRSHDRLTLAVAGGPVAPCYRAVCDRLVDADTFMERALELPVDRGSRHPGNGNGTERSAVLDRMAERVAGAAGRKDRLRLRDLPPILSEFPEFTGDGSWFGFGSLRRLMEELCRRYPQLSIVAGDPWAVRVRRGGLQLVGGGARTASAVELQQVSRIVRSLVLSSPNRVAMAAAAQAVLAVFPDARQRAWFGRGTFKRLLLSIENLGVEIECWPLPGYLYRPGRGRLREDTIAA